MPEYAFIGRSNVGKSSLINMVCDKKGLAKTSSTPGKTQTINHFLINEQWYIADLPGYGYAKTSKKNRGLWANASFKYLKERTNLLLTFLLIDSRIPPQSIDLEFMQWLGGEGIPFVIVFTKTDKLKPSLQNKNITDFSNKLMEEWEELPGMIVTSALSKLGKENILNKISETNTVFTLPD